MLDLDAGISSNYLNLMSARYPSQLQNEGHYLLLTVGPPIADRCSVRTVEPPLAAEERAARWTHEVRVEHVRLIAEVGSRPSKTDSVGGCLELLNRLGIEGLASVRETGGLGREANERGSNVRHDSEDTSPAESDPIGPRADGDRKLAPRALGVDDELGSIAMHIEPRSLPNDSSPWAEVDEFGIHHGVVSTSPCGGIVKPHSESLWTVNVSKVSVAGSAWPATVVPGGATDCRTTL